MKTLAELKPGDTIEVDARPRKKGSPVCTKVKFVRWDTHTREHVPAIGDLNPMIVSSETLPDCTYKVLVLERPYFFVESGDVRFPKEK